MSEETRDERGESQWFALARARGNVGGLTKLGRAFGALRVVRAGAKLFERTTPPPRPQHPP